MAEQNSERISTNSAENSNENEEMDIQKVINFYHPLYLHSSDLPGIQIVSEQLVGPENYRD